MPHAVLTHAEACPEFGSQPLSRDGGTIHKVVEVAQTPGGWLLKSIILQKGEPTKFLVRIDRREDGLVVRLDDHVHVERSDAVFDHLALVAARVLAANPEATLGKTNLQDRIERLQEAEAR